MFADLFIENIITGKKFGNKIIDSGQITVTANDNSKIKKEIQKLRNRLPVNGKLRFKWTITPVYNYILHNDRNVTYK